jgi:chemotaxis signal transduction protein
MAKVMVVDDAQSDAKLMESILRTAGYQVVCYGNGEGLEEKVKGPTTTSASRSPRNSSSAWSAGSCGRATGPRGTGASMPEPSPHGPVRACVFALAGRQLAADIQHTREVIVLPDRTRVPRAPAHVLGVANLRGYVVPIVDIGPVLGLPPHPVSETSRTVVLEDAGVQIAVTTDEVLGLESFDGVLPVTEEAFKPHGKLAQGLLRRGEGMAMLLDVPRLVEAVRVGPPGRTDA